MARIARRNPKDFRDWQHRGGSTSEMKMPVVERIKRAAENPKCWFHPNSLPAFGQKFALHAGE